MYLFTENTCEVDAILKRFRLVRARDDETVHTIEATKGVKDIFKFMLMNSDSGRFLLIYVNEASGL